MVEKPTKGKDKINSNFSGHKSEGNNDNDGWQQWIQFEIKSNGGDDDCRFDGNGITMEVMRVMDKINGRDTMMMEITKGLY